MADYDYDFEPVESLPLTLDQKRTTPSPPPVSTFTKPTPTPSALPLPSLPSLKTPLSQPFSTSTIASKPFDLKALKPTTNSSSNRDLTAIAASLSNKAPSRRNSKGSRSNLRSAGKKTNSGNKRKSNTSLNRSRERTVTMPRPNLKTSKRKTVSVFLNDFEEINRLNNALEEERTKARELTEEVKTLKKIQKRQEKEIEKMDKEYGDFPKILEKVQAEAKSLRTQANTYKEKLQASEKRSLTEHEEFLRIRDRASKMEHILKGRNLSDNDKLQEEIRKLKSSLEEREDEVAELNKDKKLIISTKDHEIKDLRSQNESLLRDLSEKNKKIVELQTRLKDLERKLANSNMYQKRSSDHSLNEVFSKSPVPALPSVYEEKPMFAGTDKEKPKHKPEPKKPKPAEKESSIPKPQPKAHPAPVPKAEKPKEETPKPKEKIPEPVIEKKVAEKPRDPSPVPPSPSPPPVKAASPPPPPKQEAPAPAPPKPVVEEPPAAPSKPNLNFFKPNAASTNPYKPSFLTSASSPSPYKPNFTSTPAPAPIIPEPKPEPKPQQQKTYEDDADFFNTTPSPPKSQSPPPPAPEPKPAPKIETTPIIEPKAPPKQLFITNPFEKLSSNLSATSSDTELAATKLKTFQQKLKDLETSYPSGSDLETIVVKKRKEEMRGQIAKLKEFVADSGRASDESSRSSMGQNQKPMASLNFLKQDAKEPAKPVAPLFTTNTESTSKPQPSFLRQENTETKPAAPSFLNNNNNATHKLDFLSSYKPAVAETTSTIPTLTKPKEPETKPIASLAKETNDEDNAYTPSFLSGGNGRGGARRGLGASAPTVAPAVTTTKTAPWLAADSDDGSADFVEEEVL